MSGSNKQGSGTPNGIRQEASNVQEMSQSILASEQQFSEFNKRRGFLNLNNLMHARVFNPSNQNSQQQVIGMQGDRMSSTGLAGQMQNLQEQSSNT
mmetsp:Transcript_19598/g.14313  ORF Transcript_19598/g.14313 Transcript_19598/m.14313 type:complete len:96 (-) Transcript_19598:1131-1418(-)